VILLDYFYRRPVTGQVILFGMAILGIYSLLQLPILYLPETLDQEFRLNFYFPKSQVSSPEEQITEKIEDILLHMRHVSEIYSYTYPENVHITFTIKKRHFHQSLLAELETKITSTLNKYQYLHMVTFHLSETSLEKRPTAELIVMSDLSQTDLRSFIFNELIPKIEHLKVVDTVNVQGIQREYVELAITEAGLEQYGLTIDNLLFQISTFVAGYRYNLGIIDSDHDSKTITLLSPRVDFHTLDFMPVFLANNRTIPLSQVCVINQIVDDIQSINRLDGKRCVIIQLFKRPSYDLLQFKSSVQKTIPHVIQDIQRRQPALSTLDIKTVFPDYNQLYSILKILGIEILLGLCFLTIFIGWVFGQGFWIPNLVKIAAVSLLSTFPVMYVTSQSLNMLSLVGLAVGLLITVTNVLSCFGDCFFPAMKSKPAETDTQKLRTCWVSLHHIFVLAIVMLMLCSPFLLP